MSRPWMKFYPSDWRSDPTLRACSIAARGVWMELLCVMHEASPRGWLLLPNGSAMTERQIATLVGASVEEVTECLIELEQAGVFSRDGSGVIFSRRMHRDEEKAALAAHNGAKGGNPTLKGGVNPSDNGGDKAQIPDTREPEISSLRSADEPTGDARTDLFRTGLKSLAEFTGRPPGKLRPLLGRWLKAADDDALRLLDLIARARRDRPAEPISWIEAHLRPNSQAPPKSMSARLSALTDQPIEKTLNDYFAKHEDRDDRGNSGGNPEGATPALCAVPGRGR